MILFKPMVVEYYQLSDIFTQGSVDKEITITSG